MLLRLNDFPFNEIAAIMGPPLACLTSILFLNSTLLTSTLMANDWPYFTGPDYNGASSENEWTANWDDDGPKIAWKAKVGTGAASFAVSGNRVVTSGSSKTEETIYCFDRNSGKTLWDYTFDCKFEKREFEGGTAATPTIDGNHVYNLSFDGQLHCLSLDEGKVIWKAHLVDDFGGKLSQWKYASSPLVQGDLLILDCGGDENSTLALNKETGKKVWGQGDENAGYATPTPIMQGRKAAVVVFKGEALVAHDLKLGKRLWELPWETSFDVNASSPVPLSNKRLLVTSGYKDGRAILLDINDSSPRELWRNDEIKTRMSSAVVHGNHVFAVSSDGDHKNSLICVSLDDGKTVWSQKGFGKGTLTLAGGKLIVLGEKGTLTVAEATGTGYQPIGQAQVLGSRCWVKPVLAYGHVFMKNNKGQVVCVDLSS